MVQTSELSRNAILSALNNGDFYATTGVTLADYQVTSKAIGITVASRPSFKYTTTVIGEGGRVLKTVYGESPTYTFTGKEKYVRARVVNSGGSVAWTQPVFLFTRPPGEGMMLAEPGIFERAAHGRDSFPGNLKLDGGRVGKDLLPQGGPTC